MNTLGFNPRERRSRGCNLGDSGSLEIFHRRLGRAAVSLLCLFLAVPLFAASPPAVTVTLDEKTLPTSPGYHVFRGTAIIGPKKIPLACGIFLPKAYFQPNEPMPVVVTLHNRGASGADGGGMDGEGLGLLIARNDPDTRGTGDKPPHPIKVHDEAQFIGLAPQCPREFAWEVDPVPAILGELITQITRRYRADPDRVYLTGFSYGGSSTWRVALALPGRFAAIAPLDGRATPDPKRDALKLKNVPIYLSVGDDDGEFIPECQKMRDALLAAKHTSLIYHIVPKGNHWCYASVYTDPQFWAWLFAQRRPGGLAATRPATRPSTRRAFAAPGGPAIASTTQPFRPAVLCQYFRDLPGTQVSDLTSAQAYPNFPNEQILLDRLELPLNETENFGCILRSIVRPPQTGEYTFYLAGQDQCELWLSSDETPAHLRQIAQVPAWSLPRDWSADPHQQSNPVQLTAGKPYFIEVRHKHGVGDNHASVAWHLPDGTTEGPIAGRWLSAAPAVVVPPPMIVGTTPTKMPTAPGAYSIGVMVDYLGHREQLRVALILPRSSDSSSSGKQPALVYCPSGDQTTEADGPALELSKPGDLADDSPLIVLSPQRPPGRPWENLWLQHATAAALDKLLGELPIDPERVYLTGSAGGTTAVWALPTLLPGRFTAIAPISPALSADPALANSLDGTRVHLITGVADGMGTDRANRMNDALAAIHPAPDVVYEMQMGTEVASVYYTRPAFYEDLLEWHRPAGKVAARMPREKRFGRGIKWAFASAGIVAVLLSSTLVLRRRRSAA